MIRRALLNIAELAALAAFVAAIITWAELSARILQPVAQ